MIVAGFGFRGAATPSSLQNAYDKARGGHRVAAISSVEDKAASAVFHAFASATGLRLIAVPGALLEAQVPLTTSDASQSARATGSVAEVAALAAAGPDARLIVTRVVSDDRMATCALAEGPAA